MDICNTEIVKSRIVNGDEDEEILQNSRSRDAMVCIQIEGDHTTSTDTEVQIQQTEKLHDTREPNAESLASCSSATIVESVKELEQGNTATLTRQGNPLPTNACSADNVSKINESDRDKSIQQLKNIEKENNEIAERFKKIVEMFDNFTKSLEALTPQSVDKMTTSSDGLTDNHSSKTRARRPRKGNYVHPKVHLSRYADYHLHLSKKILPEAVSDEQILTETNNQHTVIDIEVGGKDAKDVATDTCSLQNVLSHSLSCQTSLHDNSRTASLNSSRLDSQNSLSLSNDASAGAELSSNVNNSSLQQVFKDSTKNYTNAEYEKLISSKSNGNTSLEQAPILSDEQPTCHNYQIASIEASSSALSTITQRSPSICERIWISITEFCTAIFICLQVNRDCIFFFAFLVLFVVSASFLTAFFYRTLSLSSSLLQITVPTHPQ